MWDQEASGNNSQDDTIITLNTIPVVREACLGFVIVILITRMRFILYLSFFFTVGEGRGRDSGSGYSGGVEESERRKRK